MVTRAESAAVTRRALLDAAGTLLDAGGPTAVTLRDVGAMAGVTRSAPYRHFADKESLLTAVATAAWRDFGDGLEQLTLDVRSTPQQSLRAALIALVRIGRTRPHLYRLLFTTPTSDPAAAVRAAERAQDLFLTLVERVVGARHARQYGGLLMASAHGVTGLEISGHLVWDKWQASAEDLVDLLLQLIPKGSHRVQEPAVKNNSGHLADRQSRTRHEDP